MHELARTAAADDTALDSLPDRTMLSRLVADIARLHILTGVFSGDIARWLEAIQKSGSPREHEGDVAFLHRLHVRCSHDPSLIARLKAPLTELAELLSPAE